MWERIRKRQREDDLIARFFGVSEAKKRPFPLVYSSVCITATPMSTNVSSNVVWQGPGGEGSSHMCHGVLSLQLPIYVFVSISVSCGDLILALGENIS